MILALLSRKEWGDCRPNKNSSVRTIAGLVKLNAFIYGAEIAVTYDGSYCEDAQAVSRPAKTILLRRRS